jgi:hypothetical protein
MALVTYQIRADEPVELAPVLTDEALLQAIAVDLTPCQPTLLPQVLRHAIRMGDIAKVLADKVVFVNAQQAAIGGVGVLDVEVERCLGYADWHVVVDGPEASLATGPQEQRLCGLARHGPGLDRESPKGS